VVLKGGVKHADNEKPRGGRRGEEAKIGAGSGLPLERLFFHHAADAHEIVSDNAEPHPPLHPGAAFVVAAIEPVPPFGHADVNRHGVPTPIGKPSH
jgi:hypothetical protein